MSSAARRLLLIDDEPEFGVLIGRIAQKCGYVFRTTTRPEEFTRIYAEWQPTVVAVDLLIPEMDGLELLRFIAGRQSRSSIILMSGTGLPCSALPAGWERCMALPSLQRWKSRSGPKRYRRS